MSCKSRIVSEASAEISYKSQSYFALSVVRAKFVAARSATVVIE